MSEDERLLRAAARGDRRSMEDLVRRFAPDVWRYLAGMLGDAREAEDALQETFVRLARAGGRYDGAAGAEAWTLGIARRVALDHPLSALRSTAPAPSPTLPALRALAPELREALVLRDVMGWGRQRIAEATGTTPTDVALRLIAAREGLLGVRPQPVAPEPGPPAEAGVR